jgi:hypothetical protein
MHLLSQFKRQNRNSVVTIGIECTHPAVNNRAMQRISFVHDAWQYTQGVKEHGIVIQNPKPLHFQSIPMSKHEELQKHQRNKVQKFWRR